MQTSSASRSPARPRVVIIGGGFGGLEAAKALRKAPVDVTLIDRANHHLFQPLLYQVAMAGLSPAEIAIPIRSVLKRMKNIQVLMAHVTSIDKKRRTLTLDRGQTISYDYLVIAAGARTNYFGREAWAQYALGLKSVEDALEIRRRVLTRFEEAERTPDDADIRRKLTFAIIGAGPTGVELAGAISELGRVVLAKDYQRITPEQVRVLLLEAGPRVLSGFDEALSEKARQQLTEMQVEVRTQEMVQNIDARGVHLKDEVIDAGVIIWSAGVKAVPLAASLGTELDRQGRIVVRSDCTVPGHPEIFAIGDIAAFTAEDGTTLPGVSPVAMQQGRWTARNLRNALKGKPLERFKYRDKGMMATIGRSRAIAQSGNLKMSGLIAWIAWLVVHIWYLVGFKNRAFVLFQWVLSYLVYRQGARLITRTFHEAPASNPAPAKTSAPTPATAKA